MKKSSGYFRIFIVSMLSLIFTLQLHGSDSWPQKSVNATLSYTSFGGFHTVPLNIEFIMHGKIFHHGITTGLIGVFYDSYRGGQAGPMLGYTLMTGKRNNHLEIMAGATLLPVWLYGREEFDADYRNKILPLGRFGYRYQKPDGKIFYKIYFGNPGFGIGAGIRLTGK